jgi:hypothetical protein
MAAMKEEGYASVDTVVTVVTAMYAVLCCVVVREAVLCPDVGEPIPDTFRGILCNLCLPLQVRAGLQYAAQSYIRRHLTLMLSCELNFEGQPIVRSDALTPR